MNKTIRNTFLVLLPLMLLHSLSAVGEIDYGCWGTISLNVGEQKTLYHKINTSQGKITAIHWMVGIIDGGKQTVRIIEGEYSNPCVIEAFQAGDKCIVECHLSYYSNYTGNTQDYRAYYKIVVNSIPVTNIALNPSSASLKVGETKQLSATVSPSNATDKSVTWSSNNTSVATVSNNGLVTAKAEGNCTITCKANDGSGVKGTCNVTVSVGQIKVTSISLNYSSVILEEGKTEQLIATVSPSNATDKSVSWLSSNTSVATVSNSGLVTAKTEGNCTITCKANDGSGVTETCSVKVNPPSGISINAANFPDDNFRSYLLGITVGKDGILTEHEIKSISSIDVIDRNIKDLKGIEFFTYLTGLWCSNNQLTSLDVSKNNSLTYLICYNNQLTSLDVSKNTSLKDLSCSNNQLTSLDVSKNTSLTRLTCYNNQLTSLDVSKNTLLTVLWCFNNQLSLLDVSKNTLLTRLDCGFNQLTSLDVSTCTVLTEVECYFNKIKGTAMDNLVNGLPKNTTTDEHLFKVIQDDSREGNVCTVNQVAVAKERGWRVLIFGFFEWADYTGSSEYIKGDVNGDGQVNGTDLVALTNMILGKSNKTDAADVNGDGQVNGTDYVALVNIVLGRTNGSRTGYKAGDATAKLSIEPFDINAGEEKEMVIDLTNPQDEITLVQFDLKLPSGLSIKKVGEEYDFDIAGRTTWRKHSLDANDIEGGATRFLLSSSSNATLSGTVGAIIKITLKADNTFSSGDIQLENILLVTPSEKETKQPTYTYHVGESQPSSEEACLAAENFSIMAGEEKELVIDLLNPQDEITLVQFDLRLPSGLTLKQINGEYDFDIAGRTTWRKHSLDANATDGIIRFLLSSSSNATLSGTEGAIIKMTLNANNSFAGGTIILENILLVTPDEKEIKPAPLEINTDGTGIHAVMMNESDNATLYSISGQRLSAPKKGINIINGRKVILK